MPSLMDLFTQKIEPGALFRDYKVDPKLAEQAAMAAMFAAPAGITAWHGSPFKFGAFDASKIGSGEGAQAYGYGHYFAESPSVAKEYSKIVPSGGAIQPPLRFIGGDEVFPGTGAYKAASLLDSLTLPQARKMVAGWQKSARPEDAGYFKDVADTLASIKSKSAVKQKPPGGNVYKVDIPDEQIAKMLDWDKPLNRQSDYVKKSLEPLINEIRNSAGGGYLGDIQGQGIYGLIGDGSRSKATAEILSKAGIPGVRYLDQWSRRLGKGSSNLVVFPGNEGLIKMLEMNDKPMSYWGF